MKKVLLTLLAVLTAIPAFAIQVYNEGDTNVDIYGTIRGYVGYGYGEASATNSDAESNGSDFLYGLQGNSRIGVKFAVGAFSGQVEIGANEATMYGGTKGGLGFRQAWGAYSFGNAGKLLVGKTDTPTSMSGFSADIFDTDGGLNGFGGTSTGNRRFQVQYSVAGFAIALIEDDMSNASGIFRQQVGADNDGKPVYAATDTKYIPRVGLSYTYNQNNLMAKVGFTYAAANGYWDDATVASGKHWDTIHAFGVVAGVKPTFLDGKMWLAVQGRYGMNEDMYGEAKTTANMGKFGHELNMFTVGQKEDGSINNLNRGSIMAELGYKVMDNFSVILGGGYQATFMDEGDGRVDSYGLYVQAPYAINKNLSFIPQVGWYETSLVDTASDSYSKQTGVIAGMQMRVTF